ncbi:MAG: hypothetical protein IJD86_03645, partial [Clostridia bacterium]|nr:hypothetical protein [Clostridia bacterium]
AQLIGKYENGAGLMADVSYSVPAPIGYKLPGYWRFSIFGDKGMIEFKVGSGEVMIAKNGGGEAEIRRAEETLENCLTDFMKEAGNEKSEFKTEDTLSSSLTALNIQKAADETI